MEHLSCLNEKWFLVLPALDYVGGVPFDILKPVLEVCNPSQLYTIEDANPVNTFSPRHF